jgi:dolichol-phosphate mannosyltransferase
VISERAPRAELRLLVTGAAGFFGARIARRALAEGLEVLGVDRSLEAGRLSGLGPGFSLQQQDLREPGGLASAARAFRPDVLVHAAAPGVLRSGPASLRALTETNVLAALELARAADATGAAVLWIGSCFEYSPSSAPISEEWETSGESDYAFAKLLGRETFLRALRPESPGVRSLTLRPFHLYGPGEHPSRLVPMALLAPQGRAENHFGDPAMVRDFLFVDDAAEAVVLAAAKLAADPALIGQSLNLATGVGTSLALLARTAAEVVGRPDFPFAFSGAPPQPGYDPQVLVGVPARARALLGWQARTPLREGLARTYRGLEGDPIAPRRADGRLL